MIEFWTNPMSRGQIAHWMLEELGQPYTTNWLDWGPGGNKSAGFSRGQSDGEGADDPS